MASAVTGASAARTDRLIRSIPGPSTRPNTTRGPPAVRTRSKLVAWRHRTGGSRVAETMLALLAHLGAEVRWLGPNAVEVNTARAEPRELDPVLCARIRASILLAGPMLARFGRVSLPPPGGDVIGRRRVDTHFLALERLGAEVTIGAAYRLLAKNLCVAA